MHSQCFTLFLNNQVLIMKKLFLISMLISYYLCLSGCAAASATAGYALRAGTADDLKSEARQSIISEAVSRCGCNNKK